MRAISFYVAIFGCLLALGCTTQGLSSTAYVPPSPPEHHESIEPEKAQESPEPMAEVEPMKEPEAVPPVSVPETKPVETASVIPAKLVCGNRMEKKIALTFDDGPHKGFTEELIKTLRDLDVKATFFMIGRNVEANPELVDASKKAGFEIANHTFTHTRLATLSDEAIRQELVRGADAIEKTTGERPRFYRPPGGEYDDRVVKITQELGMTMVLWTTDAGDYTTLSGNPTADAIMQRVLKSVKPGGIVIMHDPMPGTLQALPAIVTALRAQGYKFVTVSEMAADPKAITRGGPRISPNKEAAVHALVDVPRYPAEKSKEDKNASSEQRVTRTTATQGEARQGTDQGSEGRGQGQQRVKVGPQDRQAG